MSTPEKTILIAFSPGLHEPLGSDAAVIRNAWPDESAEPRIERVALSDLTAMAMERDEPHTLSGVTLLVGLGPDVAASDANRLIDNLRNLLVPGVVLYASRHAALSAMQGDGLILRPADTDLRRVAVELFALCERQGAVDTLQRELKIAHAVQGGVSGEMSRIHDELSMAATIQRETLPKRLPSRPGIECGVIFRPAAYVSGDIYDIAEIDERRIGFFIADAVGHGVPAALLTMVISRTLGIRAASVGAFTSPRETIARLNDEMVRMQQGKARFATAVFGTLDTTSLTLTLTSAGHPPPLLIRRGLIEELPVEGPLLGVFENEPFEQRTFALEPGDTLLLYSDGFETAFPDEDADVWKPNQGSRRYLDYLRRLSWPSLDSDLKLEQTFDELATYLDNNAGSLHQVDDVTAVAISLQSTAGASRADAA